MPYRNMGTCSGSSDMQPWRSRQMQATHTPTRLLSAWHRRASSSTASHAPARGASWERDTPRVLTGGDFCNGDIHGHEECSTDKRQTAYPSELLDATKYPHHAINLLLQPSGPVLHTARDREEERRVPRSQPLASRPPTQFSGSCWNAVAMALPRPHPRGPPSRTRPLHQHSPSAGTRGQPGLPPADQQQAG